MKALIIGSLLLSMFLAIGCQQNKVVDEAECELSVRQSDLELFRGVMEDAEANLHSKYKELCPPEGKCSQNLDAYSQDILLGLGEKFTKARDRYFEAGVFFEEALKNYELALIEIDNVGEGPSR